LTVERPPARRLGDRLTARRTRRLKKRLVDIACGEHGVRSIADCGGVWNVDGEYTFHALERWQLERAVLVDTDISDAVRARAEEFPALELVEGNFGSPEVAARAGEVDAVLFYDVLLHQVAPDWDEVMALWSAARCLAVFNQQWTGPETVRLLELGTEEYLANVPRTDFHADVVDHLDEISPDHGRPYRDVHNIWQWGITDADLLAKARELGYEPVFAKDGGAYPELERFRNAAFLFERRG
jgi:hypothetical protein